MNKPIRFTIMSLLFALSVLLALRVSGGTVSAHVAAGVTGQPASNTMTYSPASGNLATDIDQASTAVPYTASATGTVAPCRTIQPTATPSPTCTITFSDVDPPNAFYSVVRCLACRGLISGYADGTFRPGNPVTRGQLAKILANAADFDDTIPSTKQSFTDVPTNSPFWIYIERLAGHGVIGGYQCGGPGEPCDPQIRPYFRLGANATRGQIAKIASLAANLTDPVATTQQTFQDVPPGYPFHTWIEQMAGRGIIGGYQCGEPGEPCVPPANRAYFRPGANATRGQMAKMAAILFYPGCQAVVPGGAQANELLGDGNPGQETTTSSDGVGVNTATGNFSASATDFLIPVRGPDLQLVRTYNAQAAATPGPFGFGWAHSYHMRVVGATNPVVYQENGSTLPFLGAGPSFTHDPRILSELSRNPDGTFTLVRIHGQTRFIFDAQGKLTTIRDRNNHETRLTYNTNGQLQNVTDPAGRQLLFTYDANNHVTRVDDPAGNRQATYTYDASGQLTDATDVGGHVTHYTYGPSHRISTLTDANGAVLQNTYDAQGRIIGQVGPHCFVYSFAYVPAGNHTTTTITDPRGIVNVHTHTSNRLTKVVEDAQGPNPATSTAAYGPGYVSGMTASVNPLGHISYATWDERGNQLTSTDPLGRTTTYTYNGTNDLLTSTDPLGHITTNTYDANGNKLTTSQVLAETGQSTTTTYSYDSAHLGDVLARTDPLGNVAHRTYDPATGDVLSESNPLGETTVYQYDDVGRPLVVTRPLGNRTTVVYNAYGDQLQVTDGLNGTTTYTYDGNRNRTAVQDANGHVTTTTYDLANRRVRETQPDGTHSDFAYDASGNMVSQSNGLQQTTTYTYDALNQQTSMTDPMNRTTRYNHDAAGRLRGVIDSANPPRTTSYTYDAANQQVGIAYSDGTTPNVSYAYDAAGRRISMIDGTGTSTYTYDSLNRLTQERNGAGKTVRHGYDLAGNELTLDYPGPTGAERVIQTYDAANRLVMLSPWRAGPTSFIYDTNGNLTSKIYPNGTRVEQAYDAADRLIHITHSRSGTPFLDLAYTRDSVGQVSGLTDSVAGSRTYGYDDLNRLTSDDGGPTSNRTWSNDGAYQIAASTTLANGIQWATTRGYDAANELRTLAETQNGVPTRNMTLAYNGVGDRISQTDSVNGATIFAYDQASRLTAYTHGSTVASYTYNGNGLRMSKRVGAATQQFTWTTTGKLPLLLADDAGYYIYGPDDLPLLGVFANGLPYFYHLDHLGTSRALTDQSGNVAATASYDPYGVLLASTGVANPFGFVGEYRDTESGLVYLRARYYDPNTQQFLTADPLVRKTQQAYAYVGNDPLNDTDPSGLCKRDWCRAVKRAVNTAVDRLNNFNEQIHPGLAGIHNGFGITKRWSKALFDHGLHNLTAGGFLSVIYPPAAPLVALSGALQVTAAIAIQVWPW